MNNEIRREKIVEILENNNRPISGSYLAKELNVSRQIIVQDIALLRAKKYDIMATAKGYIFYPSANNLCKRVISINHSPEDLKKELEIIVDNGGTVLDVIIEHKIYGQIKADLLIENRNDIKQLTEKMDSFNILPLMTLTGGRHYHTIEAKDEQILDEIEDELKRTLNA